MPNLGCMAAGIELTAQTGRAVIAIQVPNEGLTQAPDRSMCTKRLTLSHPSSEEFDRIGFDIIKTGVTSMFSNSL